MGHNRATAELMATMPELADNLVLETASITDAVKRLDSAPLKLVVVVDDHGRLLGTISDGDVRRGLLRGLDLSGPVGEIMNRSPVSWRPGDDRAAALAEMRVRLVRILPVLDEDGRLVELEEVDDSPAGSERPNLVVIMAGGRGSRLSPLTEDCPKPMLKVGDRPILQTIIEQLRAQGFRRFCLSLNYMADVVSDHFGDGERFGVEISYVHESEPKGTAGALSLLREKPEHPIIVLNGDLLTQLDFGQLLAFHAEHQAAATVCLRQYEFQVPYGAVDVDGLNIAGIREKPVFRCFVAAGIYCFDPEVLELVPRDGKVDMPELISGMLEQGRAIRSFPIHEYWLDIGRMPDFQAAQSDYGRIFVEARK